METPQARRQTSDYWLSLSDEARKLYRLVTIIDESHTNRIDNSLPLTVSQIPTKDFSSQLIFHKEQYNVLSPLAGVGLSIHPK